MGYGALIKNTTGSNVAIGHGAGKELTTGSNNVCIGFNSTCSSVSATNEINLGNGASGTVIRAGTGTIAQISDERDKTDVVDLPWGLEFVDKLRPVQFTWDRRVLTPLMM